MPNIDISVDPDLKALFDLPHCEEIAIPFPKPLSVKLPTGGSFTAFADISKGIPTDCSMTFSLLLQIAPFLAATECLMKVLKLLKPLIEVIKSLPTPSPKLLVEFGEAAADLAPCLLVPTPAAIIPFIRDLLCLLLRVLTCFVGQMRSLLRVMKGLELKLALAQQSGNDELAGIIQCAQENAQAQSQHLTASLEPIGVLLDLAGALFGIAGVEPITLPSVGGGDVEALETFLGAIQEVTVVIGIAADALGGCQS